MRIVIDISEHDKEWIGNAYGIPQDINTKIAEAIINAEPCHPEPHWIPVTEQPPEVGKSVLICDAYGDICLGHRTHFGYYFPDFCEDKIKDVRAWCELPEPYKEVTE